MSYCVSGDKFCVYGEVVNQEIHYTIHSAASGWTGFGVGASMSNADIYVAWEGTNGVVFSRRTSTGNVMPQVSTTNTGASAVRTIPLKRAAPAWAKFSYSFARPLTATPAITSSSSYIYAYSDTAPANRDVAESSFSKHSEAGVVTSLNVLASTTGGTTTSAGSGTVATGAASPTPYKSAAFDAKDPITGWLALAYVALYSLGWF